ncbi:subclass B1 metallo-beta-lactamase [Chitinophaga pendula]|uniref:subclass B1 metallo-beta-lactamase n=1 Tax=Chitinophaga TaxID=79328 RepID=UPI000BB0866B|nr:MULTISPECIES: subclass B1 metallo-beta-lactamase [Chitinophaga]ASZ13276.1 subclass B1 metallo-beta-lactamase [Chitinophaga sp. MD30]UCJ09099.1 subclass B1 metallo-beta-lactamase [Chitinophaga pendula]
MKVIVKTLLVVLFTVAILKGNAQNKAQFKPKVVYKSKDLIITQITKHTFEHVSFLQTNDFGNVPCNGLIITNNKEAIIFDTPTNDESAQKLIKWLKETLHYKINAIIPTHFHDDCLGGLKAFDENNIPSYAYFKTIELAKEKGFTVPKNAFSDSLALKVGTQNVTAKFFGEGHTRDNVVGYFPAEDIMFGGCLIKELDASKGYLGDANVTAWSNTVENVKKEYPNVKIVIPGHGAYGNKQLLDYTITLFKVK